MEMMSFSAFFPLFLFYFYCNIINVISGTKSEGRKKLKRENWNFFSNEGVCLLSEKVVERHGCSSFTFILSIGIICFCLVPEFSRKMQ